MPEVDYTVVQVCCTAGCLNMEYVYMHRFIHNLKPVIIICSTLVYLFNNDRVKVHIYLWAK